MTLRRHLDDCYLEAMGLDAPGALEAFAEALHDDPMLRTSAQARLTELPDEVCERCHLSRTWRETLRHALVRSETVKEPT